jgi:hypothetical protein
MTTSKTAEDIAELENVRTRADDRLRRSDDYKDTTDNRETIRSKCEKERQVVRASRLIGAK